MPLREQLHHPLAACDLRLVSLGSPPQLAEHVFGLLERAVAFPLRNESLEVGIAQGIGQRGVVIQLMSRVRRDELLATTLGDFEPSRATGFGSREQQESVADQSLLLLVRQNGELNVGTHRGFVVGHEKKVSL